ncbi:hypothetical protein GF373_17840 [bacterium]|nr:hypothetical protein [bacterium]
MVTAYANATAAAICVCAVLTIGSGVASGDSLDASVMSSELLPGELIVVNVTLRLERSDVQPDNTSPADQAKASMRKRRRLDAILVQDGEPVATFPLFGAPFRKAGTRVDEYRATFTGLPTRSSAEGEGESHLELVTSPGRYELMVCDRHDAKTSRSKPVILLIRQPRDADAKALEDYGRIDAAKLAVALGEQEGDSETWQSLEQIAIAHPDTVYGSYASSALVLRECKRASQARSPERDDRTWQELAAKLRSLSDRFSRDHPIRENLLLHQATIDAKLGRLERARHVVAVLKRDFPHGALGDKVKKLDEELRR